MEIEQNNQRLFRGFRPDQKGTVTITVNGEEMRGEWEYWNELGELQVKPIPPRCIGKPPFSPALASKIKLVAETIGQRVTADKNGKDVFEGDIHEYNGRKFVLKHGVFFCNDLEADCFGWHFQDIKDASYCERLDGTESKYVNIIGNKWEATKQ